MYDLFHDLTPPPGSETLAEGAALLRGYALEQISTLLPALEDVVSSSPFRHMKTPGGFQMSVAMTNCGKAGWVSDETGYRYAATDPMNNRPWPQIPEPFLNLASSAAAEAGFIGFVPDACLINRYEPGARLTLHQDRNERDFSQPIVSVSLGLPATFLFGGLKRKDRIRRIRLESGDVVVWGGKSRLIYHGIAPLADGDDPLTGRCRLNLTFRKAM